MEFDQREIADKITIDLYKCILTDEELVQDWTKFVDPLPNYQIEI